MKPNKIFLIEIILLLTTTVSAATYYVDNQNPQASNTNPGTEALSFLTIQKCANVAKAGDICLVGDGNYNERVMVANAGSAGSGKVVFRSLNRRAAIVLHGFSTNGKDYIGIVGFNITNNKGGWLGGGIWLSSNNVDINDNYFFDVIGQAISPNWSQAGGWNNIYVGSNKMYKVNKGIVASGNNWLVENNEVERLYRFDLLDANGYGEDADYSRFFGTNIIFRNNYFHGTLQSEILDSHTDGFQSFANNGNIARNVLIENNIVMGFFHQGAMLEGDVARRSHEDITFKNNVFVDSASWGIAAHGIINLMAVNNTFINIAGTGVGCRFDRITSGLGTSCIVKNNIFYNAYGQYWGDANSTIDGNYNLMYPRRRYYIYNSLDIVDKDPRFISADWLGVDKLPFTFDDGYRVLGSSPAINAGIPLNGVVDRDIFGSSRPYGSGWDIGAFEYVSGSPPANQNPIVSLTSPSSEATFIAPVSITLSANASDADGTISKVDFFTGAALLGTATSAPYSYAWNNVAAGTYNLTARATDNLGATGTSSSATILIADNETILPTDDDLDGVPNAIDRCPKTASAARAYVNIFGCALPIATKFDIRPDFNATDINGVQNLEIGISQFGKISYLNKNFLLVKMSAGEDERLNLDADLNISLGKITLNQNNLPQLNVPATITLNNIHFTTPKILKDGAECTSCTIQSYDKNSKIITFNVPGF